MTESNKKTTISVLAVIIVSLLIFGFYNNNKNSKEIKSLTLEKEDIIVKLDSMVYRYDLALNQKTELSNELTIQKNSIIKFKDSLKRIKGANKKLINFYKFKIKELSATTQKMLQINDSLARRNAQLNVENQGLYEENQGLNSQKTELESNLNSQMTYNDTLAKQNLELAKKVAIGELVGISNYKVTTFDVKRNGKYKSTDRARRVNAFKVSFVINENQLAKNKDIVTHVVIKNPNGEIINNKGKVVNDDNKYFYFSEKTTVPYKKHTIATDIIINVKSKLIKGDYIIDYYIDSKKVKTLTKKLI